MNPENQNALAVIPKRMPERKRIWQQRNRDEFKRKNGFSQTIDYRFGKLRKSALERDGHACVKCGMTDEQHRAKWGRPITVDHIDRDEKHNELSNFQTLCLSCHGRKDILPRLIQRKRLISVEQMAALRSIGKTFREIGIAAGMDGSLCRKLIIKHQQQ